MKDGDHVGTRMEHAADIYDLWSSTLQLLENSERAMETTAGQKGIVELKHGLQLLHFYIEEDFSPYNTYSKVINTLPRADMIEGGRGTELKGDSNV